MKKLISIIIPVYNSEKYLKRLFDSIDNQTFEDFEIIIVNDGSTDNSLEICENYKAKRENIILISQENGGLSDARNTGLMASRGQYVLFLDSDDVLLNSSLKNISEELRLSNNLDILTANLSIQDKEAKSYVLYSKMEKRIITGEQFLIYQLKKRTMHVSACQNIFNRKFLLDNKCFFVKGIYHEDNEWTPRTFLHAKSVMPSNIIHYGVNVDNEDSITRSVDRSKNVKDIIWIFNHMLNLQKDIKKTRVQKLLLSNYVEMLLFGLSMDLNNLNTYLEMFKKRDLIKSSYTIHSKIKAYIFVISPKLYFRFRKILQRGGKK